MRRTVFFWALLCFCAISIRGHSQDEEISEDTPSGSGFGPEISIGAKIGGNLSQFSQPGVIMAGSVGGFVRIGLLPFAEVQAELLYDVQGGGRGDLLRDFSTFQPNGEVLTGPFESVTYQNRQVFIQTVRVPVSVRLGLPELEGAPIQPKLILGGGYAYMIRADELRDSYFVFENGNRLILSDTEEQVTSDYYEHNLSVHGGVELDFALENEKTFSFGFIFSQGFSDLNNIQLGQPENIERLRTRSLSFNFSYTIF